MLGNLALLHRYTLVRTHVKIGDHRQAAKLLIQVAANISRFPARQFSNVFPDADNKITNNTTSIFRYCPNINIDGYRMPSRRVQKGSFFIRFNANATRIS